MKTWIKTFGLGLIVAVILCLAARAQLNSLIQGSLTPAQDSIVQITAEAMGLEPVALADLPRGGTYWWVNSSGVMAPLPCPPQDRIVPIYAITDNQFLVDDTGGQVAVNTRRLSLTQATTSSLTVSAVDRLGNAVADLIEQIQQTQFERTMMLSLGVPSPGEGGGGTNTANVSGSSTITINPDLLWLEVPNYSNGWTHLKIHSGTNQFSPNQFSTNQVIAILTRTNLTDTGWIIEKIIRPTQDQTNVLPVSMQNFDRPILFFKVKDMTGVDSDNDGIPDWWAWKYFGTINVTATNLDYYFRPLLYDYQHGQDPNQMGFSQVLAWGDNTYGQCNIPLNLTNAVAVAGNGNAYLTITLEYIYVGGVLTLWPSINVNPTGVFSLALKTDGGMVAWGDGRYGQTNIPSDLTNIMAIAAGSCHGLALDFNGNVHAWGSWDSADEFGNNVVSNSAVVPGGITNVVAIAAGRNHDVALRADGKVLSWGYFTNAAWVAVPTNLPPARAVAAGWKYSAALLTNGTVAIWSGSLSAPTNSITWYVPVSLTNAVAIAGGPFDLLVLKADGGIIDLPGDSEMDLGQINNAVVMANGYLPGMALDGSGSAWIFNNSIASPNYPLSHLLAIAAGWNHALAIRGGLLTPLIVGQPASRVVAVGTTLTLSVQAISNFNPSYQWQFNGVNLSGATNVALTLANVQSSDAGNYSCVVANDFGAVVSSNALVAVVTPPVIISQMPLPTNQVAAYQTNLILSVVASAPGQSNGFPLHYQWQFNGTNVGGNSNNYTLFVDTPTLGAYSVVVTNAAGSATSLVWQVTMTYTGSYIDVGTLAYHLSTNTAAHTNGISDIYHGTMLLSGWQYKDNYYGSDLQYLTNAVWSTNFWLKGVRGLPATPIGMIGNTGGQGLMTMVSPRHYLFATHMNPQAYQAAFLDTNNVIHWRNTVQRVDLGSDTSVAILDADLPASVGFLPVMPTNFSSYLPINSISLVQGIGMNQDMRLFGQPMSITSSSVNWNVNNYSPFGLTTNWNVGLRGGDSSNPEMLLINNQLVLVSHNWHATDGPNYGYQFDAINQQMHYLSTNNAAGTDYQLTPFSLTNWPTLH